MKEDTGYLVEQIVLELVQLTMLVSFCVLIRNETRGLPRTAPPLTAKQREQRAGGRVHFIVRRLGVVVCSTLMLFLVDARGQSNIYPPWCFIFFANLSGSLLIISGMAITHATIETLWKLFTSAGSSKWAWPNVSYWCMVALSVVLLIAGTLAAILANETGELWGESIFDFVALACTFLFFLAWCYSLVKLRSFVASHQTRLRETTRSHATPRLAQFTQFSLGIWLLLFLILYFLASRGSADLHAQLEYADRFDARNSVFLYLETALVALTLAYTARPAAVVQIQPGSQGGGSGAGAVEDEQSPKRDRRALMSQQPAPLRAFDSGGGGSAQTNTLDWQALGVARVPTSPTSGVPVTVPVIAAATRNNAAAAAANEQAADETAVLLETRSSMQAQRTQSGQAQAPPVTVPATYQLATLQETDVV